MMIRKGEEPPSLPTVLGGGSKLDKIIEGESARICHFRLCNDNPEWAGVILLHL